MQEIECGLCKKLCTLDSKMAFTSPFSATSYQLCENCYEKYQDDINGAVADVNERWEYELRHINKNLTIGDILKFAAKNPDKVTQTDGGYRVSMPEGIYNISYEIR